MSFPINTAIPAAGNNPSVDQPEMLKNFQNINSYVSVDHTAPTNGQAGQHNQVRFAINQGAPALSGAVLELFTNSALGLFGTESSLIFKNGARTQFLTNLQYFFGGTNYGFTSPWGLTFNFGSVVGVGTTATVVFQQAFSTAVYAALATVNSASSTNSACTVFNITTTGMSIKTANPNLTIFYFVVGV